jgi:hypothetical protein
MLDFITELPESKYRGWSYDTILVVIDRWSKIAYYIPI